MMEIIAYDIMEDAEWIGEEFLDVSLSFLISEYARISFRPTCVLLPCFSDRPATIHLYHRLCILNL